VTRPGDPRPHPAEEPTGLYAEAQRIRRLLGGPPATTSPTPPGPPPGGWLGEVEAFTEQVRLRNRLVPGDDLCRVLLGHLDRLVAEVTRLRDVEGLLVPVLRAERDAEAAEVTRLRGRLAELEWAGERYGSEPVCPVCEAYPPGPHAPGCWLAAELRPPG